MQLKLSGKEYGRKYSHQIECGCKATNQALFLPINVMLIIVSPNSLLRCGIPPISSALHEMTASDRKLHRYPN